MVRRLLHLQPMATRIGSLLLIGLLVASPALAASPRGSGAQPKQKGLATGKRMSLPPGALASALGHGRIASSPAAELTAPSKAAVTSAFSRLALRVPRLGSFRLPSFFSKVVRKPDGEPLTFGERMADGVARYGGTWAFVGAATTLVVGWIAYNSFGANPFDPSLSRLNLVLSTVATLQVPFLLMSQNRQAAKDRARAERDLEVNIHTEASVGELHGKIDSLGADVRRLTEALAAREQAAAAHASAPPTE